MLNQNDLQKHKVHIVMEGADLLTVRTAQVVDGTTEYTYIGMAPPGSAEGDAVWMVRRVAVLADESTVTLFAGGEARFDQVWTDHASLSYS